MNETIERTKADRCSPGGIEQKIRRIEANKKKVDIMREVLKKEKSILRLKPEESLRIDDMSSIDNSM